MAPKIFLLGGHDLEMLTIKEVLLANGYVEGNTLFDKNLSWGAKLSDYKDVMENNPEITIYGIELTEDIIPSSHYKAIDHHNEKSHLSSALEQVATLLNIELNDYQKLVAANDSGYIPAMQELGATKEQIQEIRLKDRAAQGVTQEDERLAEDAIQHKRIENGITVVKSRTSKFSPITDRLFGQQEELLIYTENELCYYGVKRIPFLIDKYNNWVEKGLAYYGGNNSFFGVKNNLRVTNKKTEEIVKEITTIYSKHIFLFPFRWDFLSEGKSLKESALNERVTIKKFSSACNSKWKKSEEYYIDDYLNYNEYTYFYDFVRDALYDEPHNSENLIHHFTYTLNKNSLYEIVVSDKKSENGKRHYKLPLIKILLHVFANGVGLLSFHMENISYSVKEDILLINDFGRRIYPQFLSQDVNQPGGNPIDGARNSFLAKKIIVDGIGDNFVCYNKDIRERAHDPVQLPNFILNILNKEETKDGSKYEKFFVSTDKVMQKDQICIKPLLDDRMFTLCWYGNNDEIKKLKYHPILKTDNSFEYNYYSSEFWYKYLFVDGKDITCCNKNMLVDENKKHTYDRHVDSGTLWGVSRYSLVVLTDLGWFGSNIISVHATTIYYQMVVLCLMQRASVLKYSNEVARVSSDLDNNLKEIEAINKSYLKFMNKMYFREVSAFDQGIEMYDMLQENMRIEREVKDLNRELDELYQFTSLINEKKENDKITNLTILGAIFLVPALLTGIWGMNVLPEYPEIPDPYFNGEFYTPFGEVLLFCFVVSVLAIILLNWIFKLEIGPRIKRRFKEVGEKNKA